jgi:ribonuclease I
MSARKLSIVKNIAKEKNIAGIIEASNRQSKRFKITRNDLTIHFGLWPYNGEGTYVDHHDDKLRDAWKKRHSKITKNGRPAYLDESSPEFYSWNLLW